MEEKKNTNYQVESAEMFFSEKRGMRIRIKITKDSSSLFISKDINQSPYNKLIELFRVFDIDTSDEGVYINKIVGKYCRVGIKNARVSEIKHVTNQYIKVELHAGRFEPRDEV